MVQCDWNDDNKHWKREARCYGLAEVFATFGDRYTAKQLCKYFTAAELYQYYQTCRVIATRRSRGQKAW